MKNNYSVHNTKTNSKDNYHIEFRLQGYSRRYAKTLTKNIGRKFNVKFAKAKHITLYGPFTTNNENQIISKFIAVCKKYERIYLSVKGFSNFNNKNNKVIYLNIAPSKELKQFRSDLAIKLFPYTKTDSKEDYKSKDDFIFHITIVILKGSEMNKFNDIWNYVTNQEEPQIRQTLLRATLLKKGKILGEYDFLQKKLLNRRESLSKIQLRKTINLLTKNKSTPITSKISKHSLFDKFINLFKKKKYFIISDLHLDHKNIIRFCNRPFNSIEGMNKTLVFNWNKTIGKNDIVYFIGDLVCGKYSKPIDYWLNKLNGKFIFIKGNHEKPSNSIKFLQYKIIDYKGTKFYLTHDPKNVPTNWNGWAICGHHHNNRIREYPFINGHTKRINVSVELINYTPLNLDKLFSLNFQNMKYLKKIR